MIRLAMILVVVTALALASRANAHQVSAAVPQVLIVVYQEGADAPIESSPSDRTNESRDKVQIVEESKAEATAESDSGATAVVESQPCCVPTTCCPPKKKSRPSCIARLKCRLKSRCR